MNNLNYTWVSLTLNPRWANIWFWRTSLKCTYRDTTVEEPPPRNQGRENLYKKSFLFSECVLFHRWEGKKCKSYSDWFYQFKSWKTLASVVPRNPLRTLQTWGTQTAPRRPPGHGRDGWTGTRCRSLPVPGLGGELGCWLRFWWLNEGGEE
jgi:hypothetical protein